MSSKSPLKAKPLRLPGESVDKEIQPKALPAFIDNALAMIAPSEFALAAFHLSRYVRSEAESAS
jgi:hypothetical protein